MPKWIWRTYQCPGRKLKSGPIEPHEFEVMEDRDERATFCPKCGRDLSKLPIETIPGGGHIGGSAIAKGVDLTYRLVEESSAERAELAGNPNLRVTNMRDHLREGDVAVPAVAMPNNAVTQFAAQSEVRGFQPGWGGGFMAGAFAGQASPVTVNERGYTGPTHEALSAVQGGSAPGAPDAGGAHRATRAEMIKAGTINKTADGKIIQ